MGRLRVIVLGLRLRVGLNRSEPPHLRRDVDCSGDRLRHW
jgi:hypothetical protein